MKFTLTIPQSRVKVGYREVLEEVARDTTIKGFRKGKAPLDVVERNSDQTKIYEHVVSHLLPSAYSEYVKKNQLKPIADPKVTAKSLSLDKDWEFEVEIAEKPEVKLNKYRDAVKDAKVKDAIWTPGKDKTPDSRTQEEKDNQALSRAFDALLNTCQVDVPELLIDQEVNHRLSQLLEQVNKLGLTIDQYLKSTGKTNDQLRQEYAKTALDTLKLEFILDAIGSEQKIVVSDDEVNRFVEGIADSELKTRVKKDAVQLESIRLTLVKRGVVDYLMHL